MRSDELYQQKLSLTSPLHRQITHQVCQLQVDLSDVGRCPMTSATTPDAELIALGAEHQALLLPAHAGLWCRVKDDGRAEAALIAYYGVTVLGG